MNIYKNLSLNDAADIIEMLNSSLSCKTEPDFIGILSRLRNLLSFEYAFCTYLDSNEFDASGKTNVGTVIGLDFPMEFMERYIQKNYVNQDQVVKNFLMTGKLQHWEEVTNKYNNGKKTIAENEAGEYGIQDGWTYGVLHQNKMINFSLAGDRVENDNRSKLIIKTVIPYLAESFKKVVQFTDKQKIKISPREYEILNWMKMGKSSWEISIILNLSERGVIFHVNNVKKKLDAVNRTHAVAIALNKGIIQF